MAPSVASTVEPSVTIRASSIIRRGRVDTGRICRLQSLNSTSVGDCSPPACVQSRGMRDASDSERQTDSGSLAEALQRVGQGDREAFRQVYLRTSAKLFGVCLRILGNRTD